MMVNRTQELEEALAAALSELRAAKSKIEYLETAAETNERLVDGGAEALRMAHWHAEFSDIAARLAHVGGWRVDLSNLHVFWSPATANIHDEPHDISPTLEAALDYYTPQHRDRMSVLFSACAKHGHPFDEVLQIVTAKGRHVWVRSIGEAVQDDAGRIVAVEGALQDVSDLVAARDKSEDLSRRLYQTLESINDAFVLLDHDWRFLFVNAQAEALWQRSRDDLLGNSIWEEYPEAVGNSFHVHYQRAVAEGRAVQFQEFTPIFDKWFEVDAHPTPEGLAIYFRDITQQRVRDHQLRLLEAAVSRQNDILLITEAEPIDGPDGPKIVYVNEAFERRTGFSCKDVIGQTPRILQGPKTQRDELKRIRHALEQWQSVRAELINYTKSGEEFWLELDIVPLANEAGNLTHWVAIERDITERKEFEERLWIAATRDTLTGLFNRTVLREALDQRLQEMQETDGSLALLIVDIDGFKNVNDTLGHDHGDVLLANIAKRIKSAVRGSDKVARINGDEFMVLANNSTAQDTALLAQRLLDSFRVPFILYGRSIAITASIGIVIAPQDGDDPEVLIRNADIAMYQSKAAGRNMFTRFKPSMLEEVLRRTEIEQALQYSLFTGNDDFLLVYQPQVTCDARRKVVGLEALVRWQGAKHGSVGPAEFIPIAEASGLIRPLDHLVIELAATQIATWAKAGIAVPVSVNVSAISMQTEDFAREVLQHLARHGVKHSLFQIEIVETVYLDESSTTLENLSTFWKAGICISIDDFGTGHSSLSYLRRLPAKSLKMDRSFVEHVGIGLTDEDALAEAILAMARALNIDVIAEGVETEAQFNWLVQNGCTQVQGYFTGRPISPQLLEAQYLT